jgi:hypothetical protein
MKEKTMGNGGNGKTNPFKPDGKSGAGGGGGASQSSVLNGVPTQRRGSTINPTSGPGGVAKFDPSSDRGGMVGTTADPNQRRPFRLNGMQARPMPPSDDDAAPAGSVGDSGDSDDDPSAEGS